MSSYCFRFYVSDLYGINVRPVAPFGSVSSKPSVESALLHRCLPDELLFEVLYVWSRSYKPWPWPYILREPNCYDKYFNYLLSIHYLLIGSLVMVGKEKNPNLIFWLCIWIKRQHRGEIQKIKLFLPLFFFKNLIDFIHRSLQEWLHMT